MLLVVAEQGDLLVAKQLQVIQAPFIQHSCTKAYEPCLPFSSYPSRFLLLVCPGTLFALPFFTSSYTHFLLVHCKIFIYICNSVATSRGYRNGSVPYHSSAMPSSIVKAVNNTMITDHHYYPLEIEIAHYLANDWSAPYLLSLFFGGLAVIFFGTTLVVNNVHPNLPMTEKAAIWWFVLCKCHFFRSVDTIFHQLVSDYH